MHFIILEFLQSKYNLIMTEVVELRQSCLLFLIDLSELKEGKAIGRCIMKNADDLSTV